MGVQGGVVVGAVVPAPPKDPGPAGGGAAEGTVVALASGSGCGVKDPGPVGIFADGDERPPVDRVTHPLVRRVTEPHLPGPSRGAGDGGETRFGEEGGG